MPALLYGIGIFALFAGLVMIGFGVPINEFSFGNTLIGAGTTAAIGGLIIIGLGAVAGQLRRLSDTLATQPVGRPAPIDTFETTPAQRPIPVQASGQAPVRAALPGRPKIDGHPDDTAPAHGAGLSFDDKDESFAPTLRNPDESPVTVDEDVSLSPRHPVTPPAQGRDAGRDSGWRSPPAPPPSPPPQARPIPTANFDAMWPAQEKPPKGFGNDKGPGNEAPHDAKTEPSFNDVAHAKHDEPEKPRAVAILKSGVVDGMGYTLYVDGSIEAELPQGTLRFASINELRSHLAKNA